MTRPASILQSEWKLDRCTGTGTECSSCLNSTRVQHIQAEMTARALELLALPPWKQESGALLLDVGCGSGLSGEMITEEGHHWVGYDIAPSMLEVALEREVEGDLILADAGHGCPFRPGSFDGAIRCVNSTCKSRFVRSPDALFAPSPQHLRPPMAAECRHQHLIAHRPPIPLLHHAARLPITWRSCCASILPRK